MIGLACVPLGDKYALSRSVYVPVRHRTTSPGTSRDCSRAKVAQATTALASGAAANVCALHVESLPVVLITQYRNGLYFRWARNVCRVPHFESISVALCTAASLSSASGPTQPFPVPYPSPSTSTHVNVLFPRPTTPIVEPPPIGEGGGVEVTETVAVLIAVPLEPF